MYPETLTTCACSISGGADWAGLPFESPNFCSVIGAALGDGCGIVFFISSILRSKQANRAVSGVTSAHAISESESASPLPKLGQQSSTHSRAPQLVTVFVELVEMALPHSGNQSTGNQHSVFSANRPRGA